MSLASRLRPDGPRKVSPGFILGEHVLSCQALKGHQNLGARYRVQQLVGGTDAYQSMAGLFILLRATKNSNRPAFDSTFAS